MNEIKLLIEKVIAFGPKLILVIVFLFFGFKLINFLVNQFTKGLEKKNFDGTLASFINSLSRWGLKFALLISLGNFLGLNTTSFVAILGAAGLAIGMALKETLGNFAGGAMIIFFKPFKVGDVIEAQGYTGSVAQIRIFDTILNTPDKKTIILPNGPLSTGSIVNYSTSDTRRVDLVFGIGYDDDLLKAKELLLKICSEHSLVLKDPGPAVIVAELGGSSVNLAARSFVKTEDYWTVYGDLTEQVKLSFDENGINFPYPHQEVIIKSNNA